MLPAAELADQLGIRPATIKDWWRAGLVSGLRYNDKGEMLYHRPDPTNPPQPPKRGRPLKKR